MNRHLLLVFSGIVLSILAVNIVFHFGGAMEKDLARLKFTPPPEYAECIKECAQGQLKEGKGLPHPIWEHWKEKQGEPDVQWKIGLLFLGQIVASVFIVLVVSGYIVKKVKP